VGSDVDPDPDRIRMQLSPPIRIQEDKNDPKKLKKGNIFHFFEVPYVLFQELKASPVA
jgi:hypothetical protein